MKERDSLNIFRPKSPGTEILYPDVVSGNNGGDPIPANALLNDDGSPILNFDGNYILTTD
jgi:hypothetical protein